MKLYSKATSDTGTGAKTRGGNRHLQVKCTADVPGGRAEVDVEMQVDSWTGEVTMRVIPRKMPKGFKIARA